MSFSREVKDEIVQKAGAKADAKALLGGLLVSSGSLVISDGELAFCVSNENENIINLAKKKIEELGIDANIKISRVSTSFKQKEKIELTVTGFSAKNILFELGFVREQNSEIMLCSTGDRAYLKTESLAQSFLIGVFLGSGTLSIPNEDKEKRRYGHHFEMVLEQSEQADMVLEMFCLFDIFPKKIERNEQFVVYIKKAETISDVLTLLGASKAVLKLTAKQVERDVMNNTNRQTNCYTANVEKTVGAAVEQIRAIEIIQNTIGLENLPDTLMETALARLSNPESSLSDLLKVLGNKISKGALAQRFKRIQKIASELGDDYKNSK